MKDDDDIREHLLESLGSAANMMRGMILDPSIPGHAKQALAEKIEEIDKVVDEYA